MVPNEENGPVSTKYHVVFDNDFLKDTFTREGLILPNLAYLMQRISQNRTQEIIYLKDTWFMPDLEDNTRKFTNDKPSVS